MDKIITLTGLRKLLKMKNNGKPLPEGWRKLVERYLNIKKRYLFLYNKQSHAEMREIARKQLAEAEGIYRLLCQK